MVLYVVGFVCSNVAFHMTRVCRVNVCFDFVFSFFLFVLVGLRAIDRVCGCLCMSQGCVLHHMCVYCMCVLRSCVCCLLVCACMSGLESLCMCLPLIVAGVRLILHVRVHCMCVVFSCVLFCVLACLSFE